eukprot:NODE_311_length_2436_cov_27.636639_g289_i0.p1 GENE.NODE_311_length_2436_cov_27.636639_g289_i0~~NODE_311_length_2436_cov_27.636639_g289_i0.p1  ORF type:complete len:420 (+),score=78.77 NODE_311_length_2436_cov_27.636639_g289_i0:1045-2304(+)
MYDSRDDQRPKHFRQRSRISINVMRRVVVGGDVHFTLFDANRLGSKKMCFLWLHTNFLPLDREEYTLSREHVDGAWADSRFEEDFGITIRYQWLTTDYERDVFDVDIYDPLLPPQDVLYLTPQIVVPSRPGMDLDPHMHRNHPGNYILESWSAGPTAKNAKNSVLDPARPPTLPDLCAFVQKCAQYIYSDHHHMVAVMTPNAHPITALAALLLKTKEVGTVDEALDYLHHKLPPPILIGPSQLRYLGYLEQLIKRTKSFPSYHSIKVDYVIIHTTPHFDIIDRGCDPYFTLLQLSPHTGVWESVYRSNDSQPTVHYTKQPRIRITSEGAAEVSGDLKFIFQDKDMIGNQMMFHFWLNTCFMPVDRTEHLLQKSMVDKADTDTDHFEPEFKVTIGYTSKQVIFPRNHEWDLVSSFELEWE